MKMVTFVGLRKRQKMAIALVLVLVAMFVVAAYSFFVDRDAKLESGIDRLNDPEYVIEREKTISSLSDVNLGITDNEAKVSNYRIQAVEYTDLKQYDKAIEVLKKAIEISPNDYSLQGAFADVFVKKGDKNSAIAAYDKAGELAKEHGDGKVKIDAYLEYISREKAKL